MTNTELANATSIMLGTTQVSAMYIGNTLVWSNNTTPNTVPYDAEIEYLLSSGTQWIDTEFHDANGFKADIKFELREHKWQIVIGCYDYPINNDIGHRLILVTTDNDLIYYAVGNKTSSKNAYNTGIIYDCTISTIGDNNYMIFNNNQRIDLNSNGETKSSKNIIICDYLSHSIFNNAFTGRIYSVKLYDSTETLVRDFIPVRKDGVGYMYDKVSGLLFNNSGSGNFVLGPDKIESSYDAEVEYLEGTGTLWINTGIIPSSNTLIQFEFMNMEATGDVIVGYNESTDKNDWRFFNYQNVAYFDAFNSGNSNEGRRIHGGTISSNVKYNLEIGNYYIKNLSTGTNIISGNSYTETGIYNICLGYDAYNNRISKNKWYYVKIFDNNTLILDLIPVRKNGIGYMYDKVSRLLFSNEGSGDFVLGPDKLPS